MAKAFFVWLAALCIVFGGFFFISHTHYSRNPTHIVIAVDTSLEMKREEHAIFETIRQAGSRKYSTFSIISDKSVLMEWGPLPVNYHTRITFYGPRDLSKLTDPGRFPQLREADEIIFITNAEDTAAIDRGTLKNYSIVR